MIATYVCVVCEKAIIAKDEVASLIGLFNRIILSPSQADIPKEALVPKEWVVFGIWDSDEDLAGKDIFACMKLLYPDGSQFGQTIKQKQVTSEDKVIKRLQTFFQINAFPIGQEGPYEVHAWLEGANDVVLCDARKIKIHVESNK